MNVTCPNCSTIYRVDPAKIPAAGVRARCAVCAAIFPVRAEGSVVAPPPGAKPAAAPAAARVPAPSPVPPSAVPPVPVAPAPAPPVPVVAARVSEAAVAAPAPGPPTVQAPAVAPMAPPAAAPARPAAGAGAPPRPASPAGMPRPAGVPPRPSMPAARPSGAAAMPPAAAPPPPREGPPREGPPRRAGNPFLSQDPSQKARRLARALISDMVVYHPAKRREGLRDGNLKELFDEEIKKSWEEFTDQVGRDLAESTSHFKDALNEILADGRQLF